MSEAPADTRPSTASSPATAGAAGAAERPHGYEHREPGVDFSAPVAPGGYLWWYVDAISDDGQEAMTLIVFVGSVFSPYYARARRRGLIEADRHCAFNTILYGPGSRKRWSMTERSADQLSRDRGHYRLGPSSLDWDGRVLTAHIDERCTPFPRRMRGTIRVTPEALTSHTLRLDRGGRHRWHPLAPLAHVEIDFPGLGTSWSGHGYLDSNEGSEPLADGFSGWDWARLRLDNGDCVVRYEAREHEKEPHRLALRFRPDGSLVNESASPAQRLPTTTVWRMPRHMPVARDPHQLLRTLEDTPFYARSMLSAKVDGCAGVGVHESLCMRRFTRTWVQTLLPFRMPRRA
jgi:carotenoid 1,2-hydratase